ncbi:MAG: hypothetical protein R3B70_26055 [Polyangiaceae bacterium]
MIRHLRAFLVTTSAALVHAACTGSGASIGGFCHEGEPRYFYVWVGPAEEAPSACPEWATLQLFELHDGPIPGSLDCPSCTCTPSETTCAPPAEWTAVPRSCADPPDSSGAFFGAPDNWNGVCSAQSTIAAGTECPGGEPCAQSVVVSAPAVLAAPCAVSTSGDPQKSDPAWTWETIALACVQETPEKRDFCKYSDFIPFPKDDYRLCFETDKEACPTDYDPPLLFFKDAEDNRECTPCSCGSPEGNACSMKVSAYSDPGCVNELGGAVISGSDPDVCFDVPDGAALGSKRAELVEKQGGTCAPSGGEVTGSIQPKESVRLCCQPLD